MAKFKFFLQDENAPSDDCYMLYYDNETSELKDSNDEFIVPRESFTDFSKNKYFKMDSGKRDFTKIKIQLGLKCNYSCDYCNQRFVPRNKNDHLDTSDMYHIGDEEISNFIKKFDNISVGKELRFELWGGEPFLYWKTMKPMVEQLREKYPDCTFSVITNGSLLTDEILDFIVKYDLAISVSHDGPGQTTRGPDPFDDPEKKKMLDKLINQRMGTGKLSFNSMIHKHNDSRADIQKWFEQKIGKFIIGEGGTVDAYDEGGESNSWSTPEEHIAYRRKAFKDMISGGSNYFDIQFRKVQGFIDSLKQQRPSSVLNQKCGMDEKTTMSVDLDGNITTCQNVTANSTNPAGISHKLGNLDDGEEAIAKMPIATGTHWSDRPECVGCPVLQLCQGSCLFLNSESKYWEISCNNAYSDNVAWLAAALHFITGGKILYRIEAMGLSNFDESRQDIFGFEARTKEVVAE